MKKLSLEISRIVGNLNPVASLNCEIGLNWKNIVGPDLSKVTLFRSAHYKKSGGVVVCIDVLNSASLLVRYDLQEIKDRISRLTGANTGVSVVAKQVSNFQVSDGGDLVCENVVERTEETCDYGLQNLSLRNALDILKMEMKNASIP